MQYGYLGHCSNQCLGIPCALLPLDMCVYCTLIEYQQVEDMKGLEGSGEFELFKDSIEPNDINQGGVGDCWLISAIAAIAHYPEDVRFLFLDDTYQKDGHYRVRLFDVHEGVWKIQHVYDTFVPTVKGNGVPEFARPNGKELWAVILEKAVALSQGSFAALEGGRCSFALQMFLGGTSRDYMRNDDGNGGGTWNEFDTVSAPMGKHWDSFPCAVKKENANLKPDELWEELRKKLSDNYVMCCGSDASMLPWGGGDSEGIVQRHAYTILKAKEVHAAGRNWKLLQLRNPWGKGGEGAGTWGDNSPIWDQNPHLKAQLGFTKADDGLFWCDIDFFHLHFTQVFSAKRTTKDKFQIRDAGNDTSTGTMRCIKDCFKWYCLCDGPKNAFGHLFRFGSSDDGPNDEWGHCLKFCSCGIVASPGSTVIGEDGNVYNFNCKEGYGKAEMKKPNLKSVVCT